MFVLRNDQLDTMAAIRREVSLLPRLRSYLRREHPQAVEDLADRELTEICRSIPVQNRFRIETFLMAGF